MPHHDNHAWFSFAASPFADDGEPVAIAVLDGTGDLGSISLYVAENGAMRQLYCNDSMFDSLGAFYSVISSTQGGWTWLSSEGRYMGAAAWGDMNRATQSLLRAAAARCCISAPTAKSGSTARWPTGTATRSTIPTSAR